MARLPLRFLCGPSWHGTASTSPSTEKAYQGGDGLIAAMTTDTQGFTIGPWAGTAKIWFTHDDARTWHLVNLNQCGTDKWVVSSCGIANPRCMDLAGRPAGKLQDRAFPGMNGPSGAFVPRLRDGQDPLCGGSIAGPRITLHCLQQT